MGRPQLGHRERSLAPPTAAARRGPDSRRFPGRSCLRAGQHHGGGVPQATRSSPPQSRGDDAPDGPQCRRIQARRAMQTPRNCHWRLSTDVFWDGVGPASLPFPDPGTSTRRRYGNGCAARRVASTRTPVQGGRPYRPGPRIRVSDTCCMRSLQLEKAGINMAQRVDLEWAIRSASGGGVDLYGARRILEGTPPREREKAFPSPASGGCGRTADRRPQGHRAPPGR